LAYIDKLLSAISQPTPIPTPAPGIVIEPLSERELEVLILIAEGASNREISFQLMIAHPPSNGISAIFSIS
jgi:ATP/maltotriose-dependent transcriptional regulator MalT